jgi:hypothetical protein
MTLLYQVAFLKHFNFLVLNFEKPLDLPFITKLRKLDL